MRNLLYWFKINSRKANPGTNPESLEIYLKIESITIKQSDKIELLGITIDKALNLKKTYRKFLSHCPVQASCLKTNQKVLDMK